MAKQYLKKRHRSTIFSKATFYSVDRIEKLLNECGFKDLEFNQTLFGALDDVKEVQNPKEGYGTGSIVVFMAAKK